MKGPRRTEQLLGQLVSGIVTDEGALPSEIRSEVLQRARGQETGTAALPEIIVDYVDKVTRHAYKVVDRDFERLAEAGYSQDAVFEITVCAATGAAMARLDAGLAALGRSK